MKKPAKNRIREERIRNEVIVDAYGPQEQAMGWYYYLDGKMRFPFQARCTVTRTVSPLRKGETVEVRHMAPEESCSRDMLVLIRWKGRSLAVPLSQLAAVDPDKANRRGPQQLALLGGPRLPVLTYAACTMNHQTSPASAPQ